MFINPKTGAIILGEDLCLTPFSDISHIRHQHFNTIISIKEMSSQRIQARIQNLKVKDYYINLNLAYHKNTLHHISFVINTEKKIAQGWQNWNEKIERSKVREFNLWLDENFSTQRSFPWGKVYPNYDSRSASSSISIVYDKTNLSPSYLENLSKKTFQPNPSISNNNAQKKSSSLVVKPSRIIPVGNITHTITIRFVEKVSDIETSRKKLANRAERMYEENFETFPAYERDPNWKWVYVNSIYQPEDDCTFFRLHSDKVLNYLSSLVHEKQVLDIFKKLDGREIFNEYDETIFDPKKVLAFTIQILSNRKNTYKLDIAGIDEMESLKKKSEKAIEKGYFLKGIKNYTA